MNESFPPSQWSGLPFSSASKSMTEKKKLDLQQSLLLSCCEVVRCVLPRTQPVPGTVERSQAGSRLCGDRPPYRAHLEPERLQ